MPGKDYGPAGKFVHDRAHRIMEDNPETPKHVAYAIAVQQGHKVGKTPKDFRTPEGVRTAKKKYELPKAEYQKTAGLRDYTIFAKRPKKTEESAAAQRAAEMKRLGKRDFAEVYPPHLDAVIFRDPPKRKTASSGKLVPKEVLLDFFRKNPAPEDGAVHALAEEQGADPHAMEEQIYELLGERLKKTADIPSPASFDPEVSGVLGGGALGMKAGRDLAGSIAAGIAPRGREEKSRSIAKTLALFGAPAGAIAALTLGHKYKLGPKLSDILTRRAPRGILGTPAADQSILKGVLPLALGLGGGAAGGVASGTLTGAAQRLRGPVAEKPMAADEWSKEASLRGLFDELEKLALSPALLARAEAGAAAKGNMHQFLRLGRAKFLSQERLKQKLAPAGKLVKARYGGVGGTTAARATAVGSSARKAQPQKPGFFSRMFGGGQAPAMAGA